MTLRLVVVVALALALVTSCDQLVPGTTPGPAPETTDPPAPLVALRDLTVAPEHRCTLYDRDDYPYPQSIEAQIADRLGGMWSPYDGTRFESLRGVRHRARDRRIRGARLWAVRCQRRRAPPLRVRPGQPHARRSAVEPVPEARPRRGRVAAGAQPLLVRRYHRCRAPGVRPDHRPERSGGPRCGPQGV